MVASSRYVKNVVAAFDRAAEANRHMPGRQGSTVVLDGRPGRRGDDHRRRAWASPQLQPHPTSCRARQASAPASGASGNMPRRTLLCRQRRLHVAYDLGGHCRAYRPTSRAGASDSRQPRIGRNDRLPDSEEQPVAQFVVPPWIAADVWTGGAGVREALLRFLWSCPLAVRLPRRACHTQLARGRRCTRVRSVGSLARSFRPTTASRVGTSSGCSGAAIIDGRTPGRLRNWSAPSVLITGHEPCPEGFVAPNDYQVILDCCGDKAVYATLPIGVELSQTEVMAGSSRCEGRAILRNSAQVLISLEVPEVGVEPTHGCPYWILSPARLPFRHSGSFFRLE